MAASAPSVGDGTTKPCIPRRVVVAVDGSQHSENALKWFIDTIHKPKDYVICVHIPEYKSLKHMPVMTSDAIQVTRAITEEQQVLKLFTAKISEILKRNNVEGTVKVFGGEPGEKLIEVSKKEGADFLVTGTRGMGKLRRTLMGSVSDYIVHHSPIPVIICRMDDMVY